MVFQSLSAAWMAGSVSFFNQTPVNYFPCPWFILFNIVMDLALLVVKMDGLIWKYTSIASIQQTALSDSLEKWSGRAALISAVLVVVYRGFAGEGGLTGGAVVDVVVAGMAEGFNVVKGVTSGKGFVVGVMVWELGGRGVAHLGGEGRDTGLTVYWCPRTLFEDEERSGGVLGLVGACVWGVVAKSRGFWEVPTSSGLSGTWKTFLEHWGKILGWLGWSYSWIGGTKGDSCSFVMRVDRLTLRSRVLTLREVLTKRYNVLWARSRWEQETRGQSHNQTDCGFIRLMLLLRRTRMERQVQAEWVFKYYWVT